jgi:hypothetical protein
MLNKEGLESSSDDLDPSWRDILLNLSEDDVENDILTSGINPFDLIIILKENILLKLLL